MKNAYEYNKIHICATVYLQLPKFCYTFTKKGMSYFEQITSDC